jgi:hypothetical protein
MDGNRRTISGPIAAAYIGSVVSLLIAYQATNAINFSLICLITGAGLAMAFYSSAEEGQQMSDRRRGPIDVRRPGWIAHRAATIRVECLRASLADKAWCRAIGAP